MTELPKTYDFKNTKKKYTLIGKVRATFARR